MRGLAPALDRLIDEFATLPGIGEKTAERLASHILTSDVETAMRLARAIRDVKKTLHPCTSCGNIAEAELCSICSDPSRDALTLCVIEHVKDLVALERTGRYKGHYHVLGGRLAPTEGVGPEVLGLDRLVGRINTKGVKEVILALNPDAEGDLAALHVRDAVRKTQASLTRIARGIPAGSAIEYANTEILKDALSLRQKWES